MSSSLFPQIMQTNLYQSLNNALTPVNNNKIDSSPLEGMSHSSSFSSLFSLILDALEQKELSSLDSSSSDFLTNQINSNYYGNYLLPETNKSAASTNQSNTNTIDTLIHQSAIKNQVDPKLIQSIIQHESGGNPNAISPAGAKGLMQLMPATAASLGITNVFDPKQNIEGGTKYIAEFLKKYNGNKELALAAYNAGSGNVAKYHGVPPFSETQRYVRSVLDTYYS
ncbi:lytic transglycosylase domain-containing protein [Terrilactibacillus laevilacticus]|uniref:Lytic transglycosylase domain-containing protein n=1 Tax=Terrilactibacillus laevilacticus TaxID=1380157 RepID=A0ABW5PQC9_9BACI|nr:lytic transglycosylase domain-containing protein [Terrilactibacillus laevilacticus]